jgi:hypothetical protein
MWLRVLLRDVRWCHDMWVRLVDESRMDLFEKEF